MRNSLMFLATANASFGIINGSRQYNIPDNFWPPPRRNSGARFATTIASVGIILGNRVNAIRGHQSGSTLAIARASFGNATSFNKCAIRIRNWPSPCNYPGSFASTAKTLFGSVIGNRQNNSRQKHWPLPGRHSVAFLATAWVRF